MPKKTKKVDGPETVFILGQYDIADAIGKVEIHAVFKTLERAKSYMRTLDSSDELEEVGPIPDVNCPTPTVAMFRYSNEGGYYIQEIEVI